MGLPFRTKKSASYAIAIQPVSKKIECCHGLIRKISSTLDIAGPGVQFYGRKERDQRTAP
jgi:hypothetical protein